MQMRHEVKHIINYSDYMLLRSRLGRLLKTDPHAGAHGEYRVRSLYFDDPIDTALKDKTGGIGRRDKFRIRCYNEDFGFIRLEKKLKINGLCHKKSARITREQVESILGGDYDFLRQGAAPLFPELYSKIQGRLLRPRVMVEYLRIPYLYEAGNVRITLDSDIRTGLNGLGFFERDGVWVPGCEEYAVLEVKYDGFLPDFIAGLVRIGERRASAFSKYAAARRYD